MGTRFCAPRCVAHENYKGEGAEGARYRHDSDDRPQAGSSVRALKNPFTNEFAKLEYDAKQDQ